VLGERVRAEGCARRTGALVAGGSVAAARPDDPAGGGAARRNPVTAVGSPVAADVAWKQIPVADWTSWILGGLVVEIAVNGTLRIYHGYPGGHHRSCCNVASRREEEAQARFTSRRTPELVTLLLAFLEHEFPDRTEWVRVDLLDEVLNTLYAYDPGIGVNRPGRGS
jgi:hypothetical protein